MIQSFSKKRRFSLVLVIISVILISYSFININKAQDSFEMLCKNADAYYTYSYTDVTYKKNWGRYKAYTSIDNKLVINNTNGVENYAFLKLSNYISNHITTIKVETLKADGTIVKLDSSLVFKRENKNKKFGEINYPIPGVEPGDTIHTSVVYYEYLNKKELKNYVNLHTDIPSKNSQFTINSKPDLLVRYKLYNGFKKPSFISNDTLVYVKFSMDKLKGFQDNQYSCTACELPYLYYSLDDSKSKLRQWKDVYNQEFNALTQSLKIDLNRATYYKRWKKRIIGEAKDSSKYYKFKLLFNEVFNNFEMTETLRKEFIKSNGYFLKEQKFDPISIRRFYRKILEDLDINYWAVFARSKRSGKIDPNYIRKGEFDHIFFAFQGKEGRIKFLYPHSEIFKYQIDEFPTALFNTDAILVQPIASSKKAKKKTFISRDLKLAEVDSVAVAKVVLPDLNPVYNSINQIVFGKVNLDEKKIDFRSRLRISGGLSTELRSFFSLMDKNKEVSQYYDALGKYEGNDDTIQIDTVINTSFKTEKPFSFVINSEGVLNNTVTFINDSIASLSIDKLIKHSQIETLTATSELNYYLDYSYSDNFSLNIAFPKEIEVLGIANGNITFDNNFGAYNFQISNSQKNQIKLSSSYKIKQNTILKENYNDLKQLNEAVKKVKGKRFIIKIKN